jgi:hypothetical protein
MRPASSTAFYQYDQILSLHQEKKEIKNSLALSLSLFRTSKVPSRSTPTHQMASQFLPSRMASRSRHLFFSAPPTLICSPQPKHLSHNSQYRSKSHTSIHPSSTSFSRINENQRRPNQNPTPQHQKGVSAKAILLAQLIFCGVGSSLGDILVIGKAERENRGEGRKKGEREVMEYCFL